MRQIVIAIGVFLASIVFLLMGYLASTQTETLSPVASAIAIVLIAVPAYVMVLRSAGLLRGALIIVFLNVFALLLETVAIYTGVPYGWFSYGETTIGQKLFGTTPWTVGFAWSPLVLGAVAIGQSISRSFWKICLAAVAVLVAFDLVLDPGAVTMRIWSYADPGTYYGVPLSNYVGWMLSGAIAVVLTLRMLQSSRSSRIKLSFLTSVSMLLSLLFWFGVSIANNLVLPIVFGGLLVLGYGYLAAGSWMESRSAQKHSIKH